MIGLVGTIWGMIMSFQEIATAAGAQPRPEKVAEGISTALFITLEGDLALGPGDLLLRLLPQPDRPDDHGGQQGRRPHHQLAGRGGQAAEAGLTPTVDGREAIDPDDAAMAGSVTDELRAEPNLTPLLDIVFQLITFFMLVINFSTENYDQRVHLPVAGSARPVEDAQQVTEDRLVLNIDKRRPPAGRRPGPAVQRGHPDDQAPGRPREAQPEGRRPEARRNKGLPTTIVFRADKDATFASVLT